MAINKQQEKKPLKSRGGFVAKPSLKSFTVSIFPLTNSN